MPEQKGQQPAAIGANIPRRRLSIDELIESFRPDSPDEDLLFQQIVGTLRLIDQLEADIESNGVTLISTRGQPYPNPSVLNVGRQRQVLSILLARLFPAAETPGSRSGRRAANARWGRR